MLDDVLSNKAGDSNKDQNKDKDNKDKDNYKVGDLVPLRKGMAIPCDGVLVVDGEDEIKKEVAKSPALLAVDESLISGEMRPVTKYAASEVVGGSIVVSGSALMRVTNVTSESQAERIVEYARRALSTKQKMSPIVERFLAVYTKIVVFVVSLLLVRGVVEFSFLSANPKDSFLLYGNRPNDSYYFLMVLCSSISLCLS